MDRITKGRGIEITSPSLHIAMLGTRGVPASYGGFETCVEQLGSRLVQRGHQVTVYCRSHHIRYSEPIYKGMNLVRLPTIRNKYLDTIVHTTLSSMHVMSRPVDIVLIFIAGNSPVAWLPRLVGKKVVLHVDGLDWKRDKWPPPAKRYLRWAEWLAPRVADSVITDSAVVRDYYRTHYGAELALIAYGSERRPRPPGPYLQKFGLEPRRYILFVGRLVPENGVHHLMGAFRSLAADLKCVIVGDASYADGYIQSLKSTDDPRIVFTGYLFGEGYEELVSHAYVFVETSQASGTHPALLEAMALGNCVVVNNTPENLETLDGAGLVYDGSQGAEDLSRLLAFLLGEGQLVEAYRKKAAHRAKEHYSWDRVTDEYERLFRGLLG